jgi:hypothetical protein
MKCNADPFTSGKSEKRITVPFLLLIPPLGALDMKRRRRKV